jgi:ATP-binding cassette subfamily B protein
MGYTLKDYGICWAVVVVCIFVSVYASLQGTMFMRTLIDSYILPLVGGQNPDYGPLAGAIGRVAICPGGCGIFYTVENID